MPLIYEIHFGGFWTKTIDLGASQIIGFIPQVTNSSTESF